MDAVLHVPVSAEAGVDQARSPAVEQQVFSEALRFDGQAAEYWRLWVLHLLLNLLSLGLYSPWAKRRRQQWFARHTVLLGDRFDYEARPWRLLIGRLLGLALFAFYSLSQDFGLAFGLLSITLVLLLAPPLFVQAQRFKLRATSWRGIGFDYTPNYGVAYAAILPMLLVWLAPSLIWLHGNGRSEAVESWVYWLGGMAGLLIVPLAHARLKAIQHRQASFMATSFQFDTPYGAFYASYLIGLLLLVGASIAFSLLAVLGRLLMGGQRPSVLALSLLFAYVFYLLVWPVFAMRLQRISWNHTRWGTLRFHCELRAGAVWRLALIHGPLVLLTAGLWWPVAAVAWARLRISSMRVLADGQSVPSALAAMQVSAGTRQGFDEAGDASAEVFNLDIGW